MKLPSSFFRVTGLNEDYTFQKVEDNKWICDLPSGGKGTMNDEQVQKAYNYFCSFWIEFEVYEE